MVVCSTFLSSITRTKLKHNYYFQIHCSVRCDVLHISKNWQAPVKKIHAVEPSSSYEKKPLWKRIYSLSVHLLAVMLMAIAFFPTRSFIVEHVSIDGDMKSVKAFSLSLLINHSKNSLYFILIWQLPLAASVLLSLSQLLWLFAALKCIYPRSDFSLSMVQWFDSSCFAFFFYRCRTLFDFAPTPSLYTRRIAVSYRLQNAYANFKNYISY